MFRLSLITVFLLCFSCSHSAPSSEVKTFVQTWKNQFQPHSETYAKVYEKYLNSVEKIYRKQDQHDKFKPYLDSLNNNSQILADQQAAIFNLYLHSKGRSIASKDDIDFKLFQTKTMSELSDRLYQGRELRIKEDVGDGMYLDLLNNYNEFVSKSDAKQFAFPL